MIDTLLYLIVSALIGALVAAGVGWVQGRARAHQERLGVRMLLRLESNRNLTALNEFWDKVTSAAYMIPGIGYAHEELEFHKRLRLANLPLGSWDKLMWESQAGLIAKALQPAEIERTYNFNADLAMFLVIRAKLQEELGTEDGGQLRESFDGWMNSKRMRTKILGDSVESSSDKLRSLRTFNEKTLDLWVGCAGIQNRVSATGNPIGESVSGSRVANWLKRRSSSMPWGKQALNSSKPPAE